MTLDNVVIKGNIVFDGQIPNLEKATIFVTLVDITEQDADSIVVLRKVLTHISSNDYLNNNIEFTLEGKMNKNLSSDYAISVHVDMNGKGENNITQGDYITMTNYLVSPPLTSPITIQVKKVWWIFNLLDFSSII